jgi:hypothetical protein
MSYRITDDVIEALGHCRLKAYLLLHGEPPIQSRYEKLMIERRTNLRPKTIEKIRREHAKGGLATDITLSVAALRKGATAILGARFEDDRHAVHFDACQSARKRNPGPARKKDPRGASFCSVQRCHPSVPAHACAEPARAAAVKNGRSFSGRPQGLFLRAVSTAA